MKIEKQKESKWKKHANEFKDLVLDRSHANQRKKTKRDVFLCVSLICVFSRSQNNQPASNAPHPTRAHVSLPRLRFIPLSIHSLRSRVPSERAGTVIWPWTANIDRATKQCKFILNYCKYLATVLPFDHHQQIKYIKIKSGKKRMPNVRQSQSTNGKSGSINIIFWRRSAIDVRTWKARNLGISVQCLEWWIMRPLRDRASSIWYTHTHTFYSFSIKCAQYTNPK